MTSFRKRFEVGTGKLSNYIAIFLSLLGFFGVLCFRYPEWLTTPELRDVYSGSMMKTVLTAVLIASFFFSTLGLLLSHYKRKSLLAFVITTLAIAVGGFQVQGRSVSTTELHLGLDWLLLDLLVMAILFLPIEMVFPKRENQKRFHTEWRTDMIYFAISHLFIQFFGVITQKPAILFFSHFNLTGLQTFVGHLPFWMALPLALLVSDLFQYWAHRIFHMNMYLWRFHAVHHSTKTMDWLAGSRTHLVDIFVTRSASFIPLYVFGFSKIVFAAYIIIISIHAVYIHANTRVGIGPLKYIFTTPQYHHWHHCNDSKFYGKNFAVYFTFFDRIFGTHYLPDNQWPTGTGLTEASFPKGYARQLVYPFVSNPMDDVMSNELKSDR